MDLKDICVGAKIDNKKVTKVYSETPNYVIFKKKGVDNISFKMLAEFEYSESQISPAKSRIDSFITNREKRKHLDSYALAYSHCFEGELKEAELIFNELHGQVLSNRLMESKLIYLFIFMIHISINFLIYWGLLLLKKDFGDVFMPDINFPFIFLCATMGSIGGFLSVSLKINEIDFDLKMGLFYRILRATSRVAISMCGGFLAYILIKSNIVLGVIDDINSTYIMFFVCAISGFSERFIPNLFSKVESNITSSIKEEESNKDLSKSEVKEDNKNRNKFGEAMGLNN